MISIRHAEQRGVANFGWLDSRHSFSFGHYYDPEHMGFGPLRVINEDKVLGGQGFDTHGHENMEIISYVLGGALEHKDSIGTGSVIRPGDVQRMTAGTGIRHSEFNHSETDPVHFLQIWILPERQDLEPGYEEKPFPQEERAGTLRLLAARDGSGGALTIHQDVDLFGALMADGQALTHVLRSGRKAWVQVARGTVTLNGEQLCPGDGAAVSDEAALELKATSDAEILVFDMA
ncbi:MAG: pirin family protein [Hyphomicrobiales bacterium]